jgi:hypothetical protein
MSIPFTSIYLRFVGINKNEVLKIDTDIQFSHKQVLNFQTAVKIFS